MSLLKKKLTQQEGFARDEFSGEPITVEPFRYKYTPKEVIDKQHQKDEIKKIDLLSTSKSQLSGVSIILLLIFLGFAVIGRKKK